MVLSNSRALRPRLSLRKRPRRSALAVVAVVQFRSPRHRPPALLCRAASRALDPARSSGVPTTCAQCATPTAAAATYNGDVRNDTTTPLLVRFRHRRQCIASGPPWRTSARSALVHRHRFSGMRYTPARTPRLPAAPNAAAAACA